MIKKKTKVIFQNNVDEKIEEMTGGIPLSKGEIIKVHKNNEIEEYEVMDKIVDCFLENDDQIIDITYIVKKK